MIPHVLFVDDEPRILQGLQRMLRTVRKEWRMSFANGGEEALALMADDPVEVVVSDMRMPGMNGGQLLTQVQARHPAVLRFVLSGQCEEDTMFELVSNSHQFFAKPCDAEKLIARIKRALALRDGIGQQEVAMLVAGLAAVPSPAALHEKLVTLLRSAEPSLDEVAAVISRDSGMAAKILQLSNSAYFGIGKPVCSPNLAVKMLGLDTLKALVLTHGVVAAVADNAAFDRVWRHNRWAASAARAIAEAEGLDPDSVENAAVAGMLHDIGALLLAASRPADYQRVIAAGAQESAARLEIEQEIFGTTHAEVGAFLLGLWGLPDSVVDAVCYHHKPRESSHSKFCVLTAVHVAEGLTQIDQYGVLPESALDMEYLERIGMAGRLEDWRSAVQGPDSMVA